MDTPKVNHRDRREPERKEAKWAWEETVRKLVQGPGQSGKAHGYQATEAALARLVTTPGMVRLVRSMAKNAKGKTAKNAKTETP